MTMKLRLKIFLLSVILFCVYILNGFLITKTKMVSMPTVATTSSTQSVATQPHANKTNLDDDKIVNFYESISRKEMRVFSQNMEDGVILALLEFLKINTTGYYVEFGTENAAQCNTRNLRENLAWTGLLMDGSNENLNINLHKETILHSNIIELFEKHKVPKEFDLFSEDTDYGDFWIVEKVLEVYKPKIVIHEINQQLPERCVTVPKPDTLIFWDGSSAFHGGSVCAFHCLAKRFNYTMVYCEKAGVNCFWLRNDLLKANLDVDVVKVQNILNPKFLYKKPGFTYRVTNDKWLNIQC